MVNLAKELELVGTVTVGYGVEGVYTSRTLVFHMRAHTDHPRWWAHCTQKLDAQHQLPIPLFCICLDDITNAYVLGRRPFDEYAVR